MGFEAGDVMMRKALVMLGRGVKVEEKTEKRKKQDVTSSMKGLVMGLIRL